MASKTETQSFTMRLPEELYAASTAIAQERLYDAFSLVSEDEEESSVAFAHEAQTEVVCRDE